jgi:hypothetical protein
MQIDIGFGDVMTIGPETLTYSTFSNFPEPMLFGYSREVVVAEKLHALVQLRMLNTRMKDFIDLRLLTRQPEVNREILVTAIKRTFQIAGCGANHASALTTDADSYRDGPNSF